MRSVRFARAALLAGTTLLLLCCSFLTETPEYSLELTIERAAFTSAAAQAVRVTYCITATEEEDLRVRYELSEVDGTAIAGGFFSGFVLGAEQTEILNLSELIGEGKYTLRVVGQAIRGDGVYEDLSFLDETVEFFLDDTPPADPVLSHDSRVYVDDQTVTISQSEISAPDPSASHVRVRYTVDGTIPDVSSPLYSNPVGVAASPVPTTLKAVAIDEAGNASGSPQEVELRFMRIDHVESGGAPVTSISKSLGICALVIYGYGFYEYTMAGELVDDNGTAADAWVTTVQSVSSGNPMIDSRVLLTVDLTNGSGGDDVVDPGPATLYMINQDFVPNPTDSIPFTIDP